MPCSNLLEPNLNPDTRYTFEVSRGYFASGSSSQTWAVWRVAPTVNRYYSIGPALSFLHRTISVGSLPGPWYACIFAFDPLSLRHLTRPPDS